MLGVRAPLNTPFLATRAVLLAAGVRISMDGRGRWMNNVFIERLWRSLKYECVYLHAYETGSELRSRPRWWIDHCNGRAPIPAWRAGRRMRYTPPSVLEGTTRRDWRPDMAQN